MNSAVLLSSRSWVRQAWRRFQQPADARRHRTHHLAGIRMLGHPDAVSYCRRLSAGGPDQPRQVA
jgi:hypothetical protein